MAIGSNKSVLIYDIECDSLDVNESKVKWFGAYSFMYNQYYMLKYTDDKQIKKLIKEHRVLVGFNNRDFDNEILMNDMDVDFKYKIICDLYHVCKLRLPMMGLSPKNFKLKTIIEKLKLDDKNKGEIDYHIFQKDDWTNAEIFEIKDYLKQDVTITKKLFEYFFEQFKPIRQYLKQKDKDNYVCIRASTASLAYRVICQMSGLEAEFTDSKKKRVKIAGGHHVLDRVDRARGHIVSVDFTSAYPHAIMMGNLLSPADEDDHDAWTGNHPTNLNPDGSPLEFYNIEGRYKTDEMGIKETSLRTIFLERLSAKKGGDKVKSLAYKIIINALYGTTGNPVFRHTYDPLAAGATTAMVRTWMKMLGKTLEENGFVGVYGFTDSVAVLIPPGLTKEHLMMVVDEFVKDIHASVPFPQETFGLEIDKEMKFMWIVTKNCYLWVNMDDTVGFRSTLLDKNTPKIIMKMFDEYMAPKIVQDMDVNFTDLELRKKLRELLKDNLEMAGELYTIKDKSNYKSKTSLQYQISVAYGEGQHLLVPNMRGIGIGKAKGRKGEFGLRYCTLKEFADNKLAVDDVALNKMLKHVKPFYKEMQKNKSLGDFT